MLIASICSVDSDRSFTPALVSNWQKSVFLVVGTGAAANSSFTGFACSYRDNRGVWRKGIITALHAVTPDGTYTARGVAPFTGLRVKAVDVHLDLALISNQGFLDSGPSYLGVSQASHDAALGELSIIGYPEGKSWGPLDVKARRPSFETLSKVLLSDPIASAIGERSSPSLDAPMLWFVGNVTYGYSGAPVMLPSGKVLGVVSGGWLDRTSKRPAGYAWAAPLSDAVWQSPLVAKRLGAGAKRIFFGFNENPLLDERDQDGRTPLFTAARSVYIGDSLNWDSVSLLLWQGANPDIPDNNGYTPLFFAAAKGDKFIVSQMLANSSRPDQVADDENTALILAVGNGKVDVARLLLTHGCDPNRIGPPNRSGARSTPLNNAVSNRNKEMVRVLLSAGATVKATLDAGQSVLAQVKTLEESSSIRRLIEEKAEQEGIKEPHYWEEKVGRFKIARRIH